MASVAKWLRHWVVAPALAGSIPVVRPLKIKQFLKKYLNILQVRLPHFQFGLKP